MKFVAILSLTVLLPSVSAQVTCYKFACDPSSAKWATDTTCGMVDPTTATQYDVRGCSSSSQYCAVTQGMNTDALCANKVAPTAVQNYPGEYCDGTAYTCKTGTCTSSRCPSLESGADCTNVYDCGNNLTCPPGGGKCTALQSAGGACLYDTDCVQTAGCVGANPTANPQVQGKCITYMSIAAGGTISSCSANSAALAVNNYCASGYCYQNSQNALVCAELLASSTSLPVSCTVGGTACTSASDPNSKTAITGVCECSFDGNHYCSQYPGDTDYVTYMKYVMEFQSSSTIGTCNTYRNIGVPLDFTNSCNLAKNKPSDKASAAFVRAFGYGNYANAEKCVLKVVDPDYYDAMEASSWLVVSGVLLALMN